MTHATGALRGVRVLVTRPAHQAQPLCDLIRTAGGEPLVFPVMDIVPPQYPAAAQAVVQRLAAFDLAIFISANAVTYGVALVPTWPAHVKIAAVGTRTALALADLGLPVTTVPAAGASSEALLDSPALRDVIGRRIVIFRGEGGREVLADTLRARGAEVAYAEVYRRVKPTVDIEAIVAQRPDCAVVTSNEGVRNLWELAQAAHADWVRELPLVVISARAAQLAAELGFTHPAQVASEASEAGLLAALKRWHVAKRY